MPSILPAVVLTKEDFDSAGWQDIVAKVDRKTSFWFAFALLEAAREAGEEGRPRIQAVLLLLGYLAQLGFAHDSGNAVFVARQVNVPKDNSALDELTAEHTGLLPQIVGETTDPEMRARIADILWLRTKHRDPKYAWTAIDAYLESVGRLEGDWPDLCDRLRRAAYIGSELGRKEHFAKVVARAEEVAQRHATDDNPHLLVCCCEVLLDFGVGDPRRFAPLCEKAAEVSMARADQAGAERLWTVASRWYNKAGDGERAKQARTNAAETYVKMADLHTKGDSPSHSHAVWNIERAIAALSRVEGTANRVSELRLRLSKHQAASLKEMKGFGVTVDYSADVARARKAVTGKTFPDALLTLAFRLFVPAEYDSTVEQAREQNDEQMLLTLLTKVSVDSRGRAVARDDRARRSATGLAAQEPKLWSRMVEDTTRFHHRGFAEAIIEPARRQILSEHPVGMTDWWPIVASSPFVPAGHELVWALALHAGFTGDLSSALHLLAPQVEHAIREQLRQANVVVSSLDADGIETERDLGWLLDHDKAREILGETNVFHLKCLLTERLGSNLRNRVAHGLVDDRQSQDSRVLYLWWLALRLCIAPLLGRTHTSDPDAVGADGSATSPADEKQGKNTNPAPPTSPPPQPSGSS